MDFVVVETMRFGNSAACLTLTPVSGEIPEILGGQFVNILLRGVDGIILRRPISVNYVDYDKKHLMLLIKNAGRGTAALCDANPGDILRILLPLGNGFNHDTKHKKPLLIGGGIGTAPMLYWGKLLANQGITPRFLLGARSATDILQLEYFEKIGECECATEDGSLGFKGLVTQHPCFTGDDYDVIYACGPMPMLKAVASEAKKRGIECVVSLENKMACGLGACLCCVESTTTGNRCTCTDGPVFNINELTWEI